MIYYISVKKLGGHGPQVQCLRPCSTFLLSVLEFVKANPIVNDSEAMREIFDKIDEDQDGFVSKTELKENSEIDNDRIDKFFQRLGKDDDETVSYEGILRMNFNYEL